MPKCSSLQLQENIAMLACIPLVLRNTCVCMQVHSFCGGDVHANHECNYVYADASLSTHLIICITHYLLSLAD